MTVDSIYGIFDVAAMNDTVNGRAYFVRYQAEPQGDRHYVGFNILGNFTYILEICGQVNTLCDPNPQILVPGQNVSSMFTNGLIAHSEVSSIGNPYVINTAYWARKIVSPYNQGIPSNDAEQRFVLQLWGSHGGHRSKQLFGAAHIIQKWPGSYNLYENPTGAFGPPESTYTLIESRIKPSPFIQDVGLCFIDIGVWRSEFGHRVLSTWNPNLSRPPHKQPSIERQ